MKYRNYDAQHKGNQVFTYCKYLFDVIDNTIWKSENYVTEPSRFYYMMVYKMFCLLDTGSFLASNMDQKPHFIHTLYLSLRTCMLDVICLYYVLDAYEDMPEQKLRIEKIMIDHIATFYRNSETEEQKKEIREKYPHYFNGDNPIHEKGVAVKYMIGQMTHFKYAQEEAKHARNIYDIFSKLEHNGEFTYQILHGTHVGQSHINAKGVIVEAIGIAMISINTVLKHWLSDEDKQLQHLEKIVYGFYNNHEPKQQKQ